MVSAPARVLAAWMAARSVQLPAPSSQTPSPWLVSMASAVELTMNPSVDGGVVVETDAVMGNGDGGISVSAAAGFTVGFAEGVGLDVGVCVASVHAPIKKFRARNTAMKGTVLILSSRGLRNE